MSERADVAGERVTPARRPTAMIVRWGTAAVGLLLLLTACGGSGQPAGSSGVRGTVVAGPQCPVVQAESPCPDKPVPNAAVKVLQGQTVVAETTTDSAGRFSVALAPGDYTLIPVVGSSPLGIAGATAVTVTSGQYADATVTVDTGIR